MPAWQWAPKQALTHLVCWCAGSGPACKKQKTGQAAHPLAVVLDIEGTVAPISFVKETMYSYAARHLKAHLESTFDSAQTQVG